MNEILAQLQTRLDALNQRERFLVMLSMLAVVGFLLYQIMVAPFAADRQRLVIQSRDLEIKIAEVTMQQQALQALVSGVAQSPIMQRREQLKKSIATSEQELNESVNALISPAAMTQVLEGILSKNKNLKLLKLENLPVEPLFKAEDEKSAQAGNASQNADSTSVSSKKVAADVLYQHAFIIELRGDYASLRDYLTELSALPWRFYWDELDYQVDAYPQATIKIKVHTVSLAEEWIRV